ncbi:hypothetical protein N9K77_01845, partial [bacterium]|nr:hypothetical protein [bacterium]
LSMTCSIALFAQDPIFTQGYIMYMMGDNDGATKSFEEALAITSYMEKYDLCIIGAGIRLHYKII